MRVLSPPEPAIAAKKPRRCRPCGFGPNASTVNDALANAGLNAGNILPDTSGSFDVKEAYGEVRVPILADTPFFKILEVGAAARVSDYSTVGTTFSWNASGVTGNVTGSDTAADVYDVFGRRYYAGVRLTF